MPGIMEIMQMCRLCLVKDQVNISIFDEKEDLRQIFLKITTCLPVKVEKDDKLPKKICDGCSYKLELLYQFVNTSVNAEKQLLTWLGETKKSSKSQEHPSVEAVVLKQEIVEPPEVMIVDTAQSSQNYVLQEENLPYESFEYEPSVDVSAAAALAEVDEQEMPSKRPRLAPSATVVSQGGEESDDDNGVEERIAKIENESEPDEDSVDAQQPQFISVASTSVSDQPGPSGVQKPVDPTFQKKRHTNSNNSTNNKRRKITPSQTVTTQPATNEEKLICRYCDTSFRRKSTYLKHVEQLCKHQKIKQEDSDAEDFSGDSDSDYEDSGSSDKEIKAEANEDGEKQCSVCWDVLETGVKLKEHMKLHELSDGTLQEGFDLCLSSDEDLLLEDEKRDDQSNSKRNGVLSERKDDNTMMMCCTACGWTYPNKEKFTEHCNEKHNAIQQKIRCVPCRLEFTTIDSFESHLKDEKPQDCSHCGNNYLIAHDLNVHLLQEEIKTHVNRCKFCGCLSEDKFLLKRHLLTHFNESKGSISELDVGLMFTCKKCKLSFFDHSALWHHIRKHENSDITCIPCCKDFKDLDELKAHTQANDENRVTCYLCYLSFPNKHKYKTHKMEHRKVPENITEKSENVSINHTHPEQYECSICRKQYNRTDDLKKHTKTSHDVSKENCFGCGLCHKSYKLLRDLTKHLKHTHEHRCLHCSKLFETAEERRLHVRTVHYRKCNKCTKSFASKKYLEAHMFNIHGEGNGYKCDECEKVFGSTRHLAKHKKSCHKPKVKCEFCDKFLRPGRMQRHVRGVHGNRKEMCSECGKYFKQLRVHQRLVHPTKHTPRPMYECEECGRKWQDKYKVKMCMARHKGVKEFVCDICGKGFFYKPSLVIHTRIHTGEKPFACTHCDRRFYTQQILYKHMLSHGVDTRAKK